MYAAIDWARCGRTDPISQQLLRGLWPNHLIRGTSVTDDAFDAGLEWALRPVAATIALLEESGSYSAYDYVVQLVRDRPDAEPPRAPFWAAAVQNAADAQAMAVGFAAYDCSRLEDAAAAFARARAPSIDEVAATAGYNLGIVLGWLGRFEQAIEVYDQVVARFGNAAERQLREWVAIALRNKEIVLRGLGRFEQAIEVCDQVVARFGNAAEPQLREWVAMALVNKEVTLDGL